MRVAVCFRGQLRTYKYTLENLKRFFNTINDGEVTVDYFVHTWDENLYFPTDNHKLSDRENGSYQPADLDREYLEDNIPNLKSLTIESHDEYKKRSTTVEHWGALFYSIYQVNLQKLKYENKNNFKYDLVINTRFDLVFPPKDIFPNFNYEDNTAYTFMHLAELRTEEGYLNFDDMIFYGTSRSIDNLVRIYPNFIIPQLDQKKFESHWEKRESWKDIPKIYKLGPGSLLSSYMDDKNIKYSDIEPRYFAVARKEVEERRLDGIKDFQIIKQIHLDFYNFIKYKLVKDGFARKPHGINVTEKTDFDELYFTADQSGALDISGLKFTTYGSSELQNIIDVEFEEYDYEFPEDVFEDSGYIYIYPLFVANHLPWHSSLEIIPKKVMQACRENKLWLLFENTLEGDTIPDEEWASLHLTLYKLRIPPRNVIFTNNNNLLKETYLRWFLSQHKYQEQLRVVYLPYDILNIKGLIERGNLFEHINFEDTYNYKKNNLSSCKHFLKINRTPRNERIASNIYLMQNDILKNTKISCTEYVWDYGLPDFDYEWLTEESKEEFKKLLPLGVDDEDKLNTGPIGFGDGFFNPNKPFEKSSYLDSFISIVTTPFPLRKDEMHLTCSTYNPIYNMQPIIQYGPAGSLKALRDLGFKTFDKWWPESYDRVVNDSDRLLEVLKVVKELNKLSKEEILAMYYDMKEVLIHNHNLIKTCSAQFNISQGIEIKWKK